jgi:hypothetical protein
VKHGSTARSPDFRRPGMPQSSAINKIAHVIELIDLQFRRTLRFAKLCHIRPRQLSHSIIGRWTASRLRRLLHLQVSDEQRPLHLALLSGPRRLVLGQARETPAAGAAARRSRALPLGAGRRLSHRVCDPCSHGQSAGSGACPTSCSRCFQDTWLTSDAPIRRRSDAGLEDVRVRSTLTEIAYETSEMQRRCRGWRSRAPSGKRGALRGS